MIKIAEDFTSSGTWLRLDDDGVPICGAYVRERVGEPVAIMWAGLPRRAPMVEFCKHLPELMGNDDLAGLRGRAFAAGEIVTAEGQHWLDVASLPKASLFQFKCVTELSGSARAHPFIDAVLVWAADFAGEQEPEVDDPVLPVGPADDDANMGVQLALTRLPGLEKRLATFISQSQVNQPDIETVQRTLRTLAAHLRPRATPIAMDA